MLASGSAACATTSAASLISLRARSLPPVMLSKTPFAPSMLMSSSGLEIANRAASWARVSPVPRPMAINAPPESDMIALTSAKSRLMRPGSVMSSLIPWMPWRKTSSTSMNACSSVVLRSITSSNRSLGMVISVSTRSRSCAMPSSAFLARWRPSKLNGLVTTPTVSAPCSFEICAITGAAPVPVPPPIPAAMNTMSALRTICAISSALSSAAFSPVFGLPPAPRPRVNFSPMCRRVGASHRANAWVSVLIAMNSTPRTPD